MDKCPCTTRELRILVAAGTGAIQYKWQCLDCGATGNALAHTSLTDEQKRNAGPVDPTIADRYWTARRAAYSTQRQQASAEWWEKYSAYLNSPAWYVRRRKVLERDGWLCQSCRERPATQVHHTSYAHVFDEPLFDLQSVCDDCHARITDRDRGSHETLPQL